MHWVLLHIVFSSFFVLCIRWAQRRDDDVLNVGAINYIVAGVAGVLWYWDNGNPVSTNALISGSLAGVSYFVAFFFLIVTTQWKGAANTSVVSRLSILVPIGAGILFWGERPAVLQGCGILLACLALSLVGRRSMKLSGVRPPRHAMLILCMFFLIGGCCRLAPEMFKHICAPTEKPTFVLLTFTISGFASIVLMAIRRRIPTRTELAAGMALGTANIVQAYCMLTALESFDGFVVFPITAAGSLVFTTAIAATFFGERLSRLNLAGVCVAICSLGML